MKRIVLSVAVFLHGVGAPASASAQGGAAPPALHWEALAFDATHDRIVLFGGVAPGAGYLLGTWAWQHGVWRQIVDSALGPGARHAHAMAFDPRGRRVLLFGGATESSGSPERRYCDLWALEDRRWRRIDDAPCGALRSTAASLVFDTRAQSLLLLEGPASPPADTVPRALRLWRMHDDRWMPVDSSGPRRTVPGPAAWDARREILVVPVLEGPDAGVWEWDGKRWKQHSAPGPVARRVFATAYAAHLGGVLIAGGRRADDEQPLADAWLWNGRAWTALAPPDRAKAPVARSHATLLADAARDRVAYFGGVGADGLLTDFWWLDAGGWHQEPLGTAPVPRRR